MPIFFLRCWLRIHTYIKDKYIYMNMYTYRSSQDSLPISLALSLSLYVICRATFYKRRGFLNPHLKIIFEMLVKDTYIH